jgi:hypothetical protein
MLVEMTLPFLAGKTHINSRLPCFPCAEAFIPSYDWKIRLLLIASMNGQHGVIEGRVSVFIQ